MMNKTALQQFIEWGNQMIGDHPAKTLSFYEAIDKAEEMLELEKQQIKDAWMDGMEGILHEIAAEKYYNETYKSNQ